MGKTATNCHASAMCHGRKVSQGITNTLPVERLRGEIGPNRRNFHSHTIAEATDLGFLKASIFTGQVQTGVFPVDAFRQSLDSFPGGAAPARSVGLVSL